ncbi:hypothetical protein PHLCEN_2v8109 [Hermanssonia centrifuga]|uniref:Protein kinase domain-containing protein n=1 Tax=Hermanssonia centrifuga TaxID=98765 RepID=A0A2R6NUM8_9APHY|nr:hypothetical protein PHLCEN_2v8109 [Hermanssonia centrifuga]
MAGSAHMTEPRILFLTHICVCAAPLVAHWGGWTSQHLANLKKDAQPLTGKQSDELGWDPTVRLLKDDQQTPQYDITVRTEDGEKLVYRTLELISDLAVESAIGKGTRVWKVIRLRNGEPFGEPAVLKDSWVDKDRPREGTICQELRSFAGPVEPPPGLADALLTVECYGDVFIEPGPDLIYLDHTIQLPTTQPPNCGISPPPVWSVGRYKIHHRIVFKEICTPMMNSSAFQNVFRVLGQACLALQALHTAGWVHRDISSANILIDNTGRAKLIDLEYAKKVDEECAKEMRVGTAKFMAAELILRRYQYRRMRTPELMAHLPPKRNREEDYRLLFDTQSLPPIESPPPAPRLPSPKPKPPFRYNAIHDFESLWWLTTYYVFKMEAVVDRTSTSLPKPQLKNLEQQRAHADKLSYDRSWRDVVMLNTDAFIESVHALDPSVRPFGMIMEQWRKKILRAYYQAEETLIPDAKSAMQGLYSEFAKDLVWISDALASKTVMIEETWTNEEPVVVTVAKETSKRKREDDEDKSEQKAEEPADSPRSRKRARNTCPPHMVDGPAARTRARLKAKAR